MGKKRNRPMAQGERQFWESGYENYDAYAKYYDQIIDLAISRISWEGLPAGCDPRYIELGLATDGAMLYFKDENLIDENLGHTGEMCLRTMYGSRRTFNDLPVEREAYTSFHYRAHRTIDDSVLIFNNYLRTPIIYKLAGFAKRLADLERTIDVNINAQKTPILVQADERDRLTMMNLYQQYSGNQPFIFSTKAVTMDSLKVLNTSAPFVADKLFELKEKIWNEMLTFLGISNVAVEKKERMIVDEAKRQMGGAMANRYSYLEARKDACVQIEKMFGTKITVDFREDLNTSLEPEEAEEVPKDNRVEAYKYE